MVTVRGSGSTRALGPRTDAVSTSKEKRCIVVVLLLTLAFTVSQYFYHFGQVQKELFRYDTQHLSSLPPNFILPSVRSADIQEVHVGLASKETSSSRVIVAICSCTVSMKDWTSNTNNTLETLMIPSIIKTVTEQEREIFKFLLHIGIDEGDAFWEKHLSRIQTPDWLEFVHHSYPKKGKIPFNPLMRDVYNAGADYLVRINDDSEFTSQGWATHGVAALRSMEPPNVGVIGAMDPRNMRMFTHDMVHRTHLDIFDQIYYTEAFSNWWIDDWITSVYRPYRSKWVKPWTVKHHSVHGTRYNVDHSQKLQLDGEILRGREKIRMWLEANGHNATEKPFDQNLLSTHKEYLSFKDVPKMWIVE